MHGRLPSVVQGHGLGSLYSAGMHEGEEEEEQGEEKEGDGMAA